MTMLEPNELFKIDLKAGTSSQITFTNKANFATVKSARIEKRFIKATDGKDILTWIIYPPDFDAKKKYPALLYCQGGPQSTVSQFWSFRWNFQIMAANGYIVVAPNRRGLPSFGKAWNDEISLDWGGQPMKDLLSAIDSMAKEPFINKDKLGAVGASYGGYSVYWLAGNHNKRFKAFIAHDGVFNLQSMNAATEELWFPNNEFGGMSWNTTRPDNYQKFSPINYVKNWDTPILIITNQKDYRVPIEQGLEAYTAARLQNVNARLLTFPDENHWVLKPQNSVLWQRVFYEWLDKYLK
jgi:dipeptidyl aminopeptidase/acylaminoacyl peptidase